MYNNSQNTNIHWKYQPSSLLNDEIVYYIDIYLRTVTVSIMGFFGTASNCVNFLVFLKQGIKDCLSVCLISLTITDFASVGFGFTTVFFMIIIYLNVQTDFDPDAILFVLNYATAMFYDISTTMTAFIAVERCLCVTAPFKFKEMITLGRALIITVLIYIFIIGMYLQHYMASGLTSRFDPSTNSTRTVLWMSPNYHQVELVLNTAIHIIWTFICLVAILISTLIMINGLQRSLKFKRSGFSKKSELRSKLVQTKSDVKVSSRNTKSVNKSTMSSRNQKVVKTVVALALISFICNFMRFLIVVFLRIFPELSYGGRYENMYLCLLSIAFVFQTTNASVNVLVYYAFNDSFRKKLKEVFCCSKLDS